MKKRSLFSMALLLAGVLFVQESRGQDYTRWGLPDGAFVRLGKGYISSGDRTVVYSPDGTRIAVATGIGTWLHDAATGVEVAVLHGHTARVYSVSFSPDGRTLASGSEDDTVRLWDVANGEQIAVLQHTDWVYSVSFSPDGRTLASGSGSTVRLWDAESGEEIAVLRGHTDYVRSVSFSPDGRTLASGSLDYTVRLWDVASGEQIAVLHGHTASSVHSVSFSPDGRTLASGNHHYTVHLWDVASGEQIAVLQGHTARVYSVSFSPDGRTLASGSEDGTILLWDMSPYVTLITAVELTSPSLPAQTVLLANYPNPFNSRTHLAYRLAASGVVRLELYNVLGQRVRTLVDRFQAAGEYQVAWDARDGQGAAVSSGVYLTRLYYPDGRQTRRVLLLK